MKTRGWRFNGLQYPDGLHLAVTRPQTRDGVVDRFRTDLADAVAYAQEQTGSAESTAIYGGIPGGLTADVSTFIESVMGRSWTPTSRCPPRDDGRPRAVGRADRRSRHRRAEDLAGDPRRHDPLQRVHGRRPNAPARGALSRTPRNGGVRSRPVPGAASTAGPCAARACGRSPSPGQWSSVADSRRPSPAGPLPDVVSPALTPLPTIVGGPVLGYDPRWLTAGCRARRASRHLAAGDPVSHMLGFQHDEPGIAAGTAHLSEPVGPSHRASPVGSMRPAA